MLSGAPPPRQRLVLACWTPWASRRVTAVGRRPWRRPTRMIAARPKPRQAGSIIAGRSPAARRLRRPAGLGRAAAEVRMTLRRDHLPQLAYSERGARARWAEEHDLALMEGLRADDQ